MIFLLLSASFCWLEKSSKLDRALPIVFSTVNSYQCRNVGLYLIIQDLKFLPTSSGRISFLTILITTTTREALSPQVHVLGSNSTTTKSSHWWISKTTHHLLPLLHLKSHLPYHLIKRTLTSSQHYHAQGSHPRSKSHP